MLFLTYAFLFISLYFEVFLLMSFIEKMYEDAPTIKKSRSPVPSVAIVVPCFNEQRGLAGTLQSLCALVYPKGKLEIIVVDDGSTDNTLAIAHTFAHDPRIRIFSKPNGGKHTAMNLALSHTSAEFIGCLDADSTVAPNALEHIVPVFANASVAAVTPGIMVKETRNALQHMQQVEYHLSVFNRFILAALGSTFITPGPFSIFRTAIIRKLGGWRYAHSTEDMEMALRMQAEGYLIANAPRATVHTATPSTLRTLFKQRVRWTYGFLRNVVDYRYMIGSHKFGNLGLLVLPSTIVSIGIGIYFFVRLLWQTSHDIVNAFTRIAVTETIPRAEFDLFYVNTSALWFIVWLSVAIILVLISAGSWIGTGSRRLPTIGTPLFVFFYCFLVPTWLVAAVYRATFKTGVQWR
jgi:cellulose synthase/poly-beta-1,6-N-acetylglucosamine synthase-like glycosyltransferase